MTVVDVQQVGKLESQETIPMGDALLVISITRYDGGRQVHIIPSITEIL